MAFDPFVAIRFTSYYASLTNWPDLLGKVFGVLGFHTRNPTALEFVTAVREWQLARPPLVADGLLGSHTWNELLPTVRAFTGAIPAGTCPDWAGPPKTAVSVPNLPPTTVVNPITHDAEDRVLQAAIRQWLHAGGTLEPSPYIAVAVGIEHASEAARVSSPTLPTGGICGVLQVGQVWPGLMGTRTIVALITGSPSVAGAVIFITNSGQAYYQTAEAWSADYLAGVYAGAVRNLVPLQTLRASEIEPLLRAVAAVIGRGAPADVNALVDQLRKPAS